MDDLKLYAKNDDDLEGLISTVKRFNFNIINWTWTEIKKKMDAKVRKILTCHRIHHPRADIECLYIKRENGVLIQLDWTNKITTIGFKDYYNRLDARISKHTQEAK